MFRFTIRDVLGLATLNHALRGKASSFLVLGIQTWGRESLGVRQRFRALRQ